MLSEDSKGIAGSEVEEVDMPNMQSAETSRNVALDNTKEIACNGMRDNRDGGQVGCKRHE